MKDSTERKGPERIFGKDFKDKDVLRVNNALVAVCE